MKSVSRAMKWTILLLILSGFIFLYSFSMDSKSDSELDVSSQIESSISAFVGSHQSTLILDHSTVPQLYSEEEMVDPAGLLPSSHKFPLSTITALYRYSTSCSSQEVNKLELDSKSALYKTLVWHKFLCRELEFLPIDFFSKGPYLHPSGSSFSYLAFSSGLPAFKDSNWIKENGRYFHIKELAKIESDSLFSEPQIVLAKSSLDTLRALSISQNLILDTEYVFLKRQIEERQSEYQVFSRNDWNKFFKRKALYPVEIALESKIVPIRYICVTRDGNVCWQSRLKFSIDFIEVAKALAMVGFGVVLLNLIGIGIYKVRLERRNHQARVLILRTITHELRTPVASIELSLENFRHHYDRLTSDLQVNFIRMCNDVQRLRRLIESSTQYLQSSENGQLLILKPVYLSSVNSYMESLLEEYSHRITLHPLENDCSFILDPFWVGICIKNLLDNALIHGIEPVEVKLYYEPQALSISVSDSGTNPNLDLEDLKKPFTKRSTSPGLGLGLTIVLQVLSTMKAKLHYKPSPSTFTITLKATHEENLSG
jgi:signal transduction histidine kinase